MANLLAGQTSPYLLQHAENPVDWYPWGNEAFDKARAEDKPVFLSIGYSTCHWCHVMARESFEDEEIADILNRYFVSVKVDREERPDLDSIYMEACQSLTGSGGWPMSIFLTAEQKPFFAGTYFPKSSRRGMLGLKQLLLAVHEKWQTEREALLHSADEITDALRQTKKAVSVPDEQLIDDAIRLYKDSFDEKFGGFGDAPKFPAPHNVLFLMRQYQKRGDSRLIEMAETTLSKMYAGGLFDHIGYGFCRYSTDRAFLIPHFEKMLYDNALLILAYCKAHEITEKPIYLDAARKTASYIFAEMTSPEGAFYSAQDADSEGVEGRYYLFRPEEIRRLLGEGDGAAFNEYYDITEKGNFEGKSIPNRLRGGAGTGRFDAFLPTVLAYRRRRSSLRTDDKILTAWNALMIAALCALYRASREEQYLTAAKRAQGFIETSLCEQDTLYVSFREGKRGSKGMLDDYADDIYALLALYDATLDEGYLNRAEALAGKAISDFFDADAGGFYLYGKDGEELIFRPKESYDGAVPSGNSVMTHCLVRLNALRPNADREAVLQKQLSWLCGEAKRYPAGYAMFLSAFSDVLDPPDSITVVLKDEADLVRLPFSVAPDACVRVLHKPTEEYRLVNDKTTYYVCREHRCLPPANALERDEG